MTSAIKPKRKLIPQPNGGALLTPFKKGESGNPAGPKKSQLNLIKEKLSLEYDFELSRKDVKDLLQLLVFAPKSELDKLKDGEHTPVVIKNYITALYNDTKRGQINAARDLLEMQFGKAVQPTAAVPPALDLSTLNAEKIFDTIKYLVKFLDMSSLKDLVKMIADEVNKKKVEGAKVINQN